MCFGLPTAVKQLDTPYPLIDADPHFSRVVRSFRGSDYAAWAGATAAFPSAIYMMELFDPTRPKRGLGSALRLSSFLGLCGGFLFAYQRSSFRFWGWRENEIEQQAHKAALDAGVKPPGTDPSKSDLSEYMQGVAHRNSAFSQLKFSKHHTTHSTLHTSYTDHFCDTTGTLPWFNLVDHPYHGTQQESSS